MDTVLSGEQTVSICNSVMIFALCLVIAWSHIDRDLQCLTVDCQHTQQTDPQMIYLICHQTLILPCLCNLIISNRDNYLCHHLWKIHAEAKKPDSEAGSKWWLVKRPLSGNESAFCSLAVVVTVYWHLLSFCLLLYSIDQHNYRYWSKVLTEDIQKG